MSKISDKYETCPYCGERDKPCSEITSLARAHARAVCRKKHNGVPLEEPSVRVSEDLDSDL
jgi:hypothetical protein